MNRNWMMIAVIVLLTVAGRANDTTVLKHVDAWQQVLHEAQQENKLIFVDCYFTGCFPCAQMDKEVFPTALVAEEFRKKYVAVKIDVFKEKLGDSINKKYAITGYPTFLVMNSKGELLHRFSGFNDAGQLLSELSVAEKMAPLGGFSTSFDVAYPEFYLRYFNRSAEPLPPHVAADWLVQQTDLFAEPVGMAMIITRKLPVKLEDALLDHYSRYRALFGQGLVMNRAIEILKARMVVNANAGTTTFERFIASNEMKYPSEDWRIMKFLLGYHYYNSVAKDTVAFLQFANQQPVLYMNYMGALYNAMLVKKQLNETTLPLFCGWATKAVNNESGLDAIRSAAYMCRANKDEDGYRRFMQMALNKARKLQLPTGSYEKALAANQPIN